MMRKLAVVAVAVALVACAGVAPSGRTAPDEELLGKSRGYPPGTRATWFFDEAVRVGSFSSLDRIFPHRVIAKAESPSPLPKSLVEPVLRYRYQGREYTLDDYLSHQRTTGLLVIKDGQIVAERYQYNRTPSHRLLSNSMAKSIVSLAFGIALRERTIRSLDDKAADYVPELADSAYGQTTLRNLLRMSSGVRYTEDYSGKDDSSRFARASAQTGLLSAIRLFNDREAPAGTRFHYATIETHVLGLVLHRATGREVAGYVGDKLWRPMGAESDATWIIGPDGHERFGGNFSATLRDWGRVGVLLANDGMRNGQAIIPGDYLVEATDKRRHPGAFAPRGRGFGYGYQFWTMPGEARRFALLGVYGQAIYVDPQLRLVLVHTAAAKTARIGNESMGPELRALWAGLVDTYSRIN